MATYTVIQDVEAEDKLVGPLTLKQFIFAGITATCLYISFLTLTKGLWIVAVILLPIIIVFGFLAWPWGRDQPTEVWLEAKIRFFFKPRRRIWDQSGQIDLVTITAPKRIERHLTDELSQTEVKSRLHALADTIDSRGWAVRNNNVNDATNPSATYSPSDRLVDVSSLPMEVPTIDVLPADDMLDPLSNPTAAHLDEMVTASANNRREQMTQMMANPPAPAPALPAAPVSAQPAPTQTQPPADYWFMNQPQNLQNLQPGMRAFGTTTEVHKAPVSEPEPSAEDLALLDKIHSDQAKASQQPKNAYGHTKVIKPLDAAIETAQAGTPANNHEQNMTGTPDPVILGLATNDDLNVATIAREAEREKGKNPPTGGGNDEVVVSFR